MSADASTKTRHRAGERGYSFNVLLSEDELGNLEDIAQDLGWSRAAVIRYGLGLAEDRREEMREAEPPGNRREPPG